MSGLEVAGIVLGAVPIAITALEKYGEVAKRLGLFYKIRLEHKKCHDQLRFLQVALTRHFRQLLLPLTTDDALVEKLLSNPGGDYWKLPLISMRLQERLQGSHETYIDHIHGMKRAMEDLNRELAMDSEAILEQVKSDREPGTKARIANAMMREGRAFQLYRFRFSNGEATRKRLFTELTEYHNKLEKLLDSSDRDTQLVRQRSDKARAIAADSALCDFWINASKLFRVLASAWKCCCREEHCAQLRLQHRTMPKSEFRVIFGAPASSGWDVRYTRISEGSQNDVATFRILDSVPIRPARQEQIRPAGTNRNVPGSIARVESSRQTASSVTVTTTAARLSVAQNQPIADLCVSLERPSGSCYGHVTGEDGCFIVLKDFNAEDVQSKTVTLEQVLRREAGLRISRKERYTLSLILASSVLQLLDTPWLPRSLNKSEVVFLSHPDNTGAFQLDQPHLSRYFVEAESDDGHALARRESIFCQSLDQLGVVLLELCFGDVLENQQYRRNWPLGDNNVTRAAFDVMAARDWQCEVNEEAGPDYSEAVGWCLGGNRSIPPDRWRQEMLRKVVQPLQRCRDYLQNAQPL